MARLVNRWSMGLAGLGLGTLLLAPRGAAPALLVLLPMALSALGLGLVLTRRDTTAEPVARGIQATLLGAGILSLAVVTLGWTGLPLRWIVLAIWLIPAPLTARAWMAWARRLPTLPDGLPGRILCALAVVVAFTLLHYSALPPVDHDSRLYHLALPEQWLLRDSTAPLPPLGMSWHPMLVEGSFVAGMAAAGDLYGAKLVAWLWTILALAAAGQVGARLAAGRAEAGLATALLFATLPVCWVTGILTYNDMAVAGFQLAAVDGLLRWHATRRVAPLLMAAALCGLSLAAKYPAFPTLVAPFAAALVLAIRSPTPRLPSPRVIAAALALLAAPALPHLLRNAVLAGNPVHPVFADARDSGDVDATAHEVHAAMTMREMAGVGGFLRSQVRGIADREGFDFLQDPDPALLLLWPVAGVAALTGPPAMAAATAALSGTAALALFTRTARYFLAGPALLLALAVALAFTARSRSTRRALALGLVVLGAVNAWRAQTLQERMTFPSALVLGRITPEEHAARTSPQVRALLAAAHVLPPEAHVLFVGEHRSLWLRRRALASADYDPSPLVILEREAERDGLPLRDVLRARGITHVLVNDEQAARFDELGHFRELGEARWQVVLRELPLDGPLMRDPVSTITLWRLR